MARMNDSVRSLLGAEIKKALFIANKRQEDFAREAGITKTHLSLIINGKRLPGKKITPAIANLLGVSEDEVRQMALKIA